MARGWESKSVESQQDDAARDRALKPALTEQERRAANDRRTLELSRARAADDLTRARSPHHRHLLEQTLAALDDRLSKIIAR